MATAQRFLQPHPTAATEIVHHVVHLFGEFGRMIGRAFMFLGESPAMEEKARKFQALNALSDEELAGKGLNRDQIAGHVFGPLFN